MGPRPADSVAMGHARKRGERATGDARAGGSDGRKFPSATADEGETRGRHGARWEQGAKKEASGDGREHTPWEWGETLEAVRPPEWTPKPTE